MKKIVILVYFMALSSLYEICAANSDEFTFEELQFKVVSEEPPKCEVIKQYFVTYPSDLKIPEIAVNSNGINYTVTGIRKGAFKDCKELKSVFIPQSIEVIGDEAFMNCYNLETVTTPEASFKTLGALAFGACINLSKVNLPGTLIHIKGNAFYQCPSITKVHLPCSVTLIDGNPFTSSLNIREITVDPNNPFFMAEDNVLYDKEQKLVVCVAPQKRSVSLPDGLLVIGNHSFSSSSIRSIDIPNTVVEIKSDAFSICNHLTTVKFPESLVILGSGAFSQCSSLESINLPQSLEEIGWQAFSGCNNLKEVIIPDNVKTIGTGAFSFCKSLAKIILGKNLERISYEAFDFCQNLMEIESRNVTPPSAEQSTFTTQQYENANLTVPNESLTLYQEDAVWKNFYKISSGISNAFTDPQIEYKVMDGTLVILSELRGTPLSVYDIGGNRIFHEESYSGNPIKVLKHGVHIVSTFKGNIKVAL